MALDPCLLPLDEGSCTAYTLRWYHRAVAGGTDACHPFVYGGCGGNANRFGTREACERRCMPRVVQSQGTGMGLPLRPERDLDTVPTQIRSWSGSHVRTPLRLGGLGQTSPDQVADQRTLAVESPPCSPLKGLSEDPLSEVRASLLCSQLPH